MAARELTGKTAVAVTRGHYPTPDGRSMVRMPGEKFPVLKGLEKGSWFREYVAGDKPPVPPAPPPSDPVPETLTGEQQRRARRDKAANLIA